jgi:tRNA nucleotidyltransferase (CCA-adding enzyme)
MKGIEIIGRLNDKMIEAYIVGGAVRDILLNKDFNDIDICTTATPNEVMEIFPGADNRYADMGVITIREGDLKFEITTFRIEEYSGKSRIPTKVHYSKRLIDDILRRDYTVNALALSATFNVIDITRKGIKDLKRKKVRIIGRGKKRYFEDPIRIFRGLELVAKYNFGIRKIRFVYSKENSDDSLMFLIEGRKNMKDDCKVLKPIYIYDQFNNYTDEVLKIYNFGKKE